MKLLLDFSIAILSMMSFFMNRNIIGYANFVMGCMFFICTGIDLQRFIDKELSEKLDDTKNQ